MNRNGQDMLHESSPALNVKGIPTHLLTSFKLLYLRSTEMQPSAKRAACLTQKAYMLDPEMPSAKNRIKDYDVLQTTAQILCFLLEELISSSKKSYNPMRIEKGAVAMISVICSFAEVKIADYLTTAGANYKAAASQWSFIKETGEDAIQAAYNHKSCEEFLEKISNPPTT